MPGKVFELLFDFPLDIHAGLSFLEEPLTSKI
jgi:hypothetical protein